MFHTICVQNEDFGYNWVIPFIKNKYDITLKISSRWKTKLSQMVKNSQGKKQRVFKFLETALHLDGDRVLLDSLFVDQERNKKSHLEWLVKDCYDMSKSPSRKFRRQLE